MPFDSVGMRSVRSSTSEAGVFLRRLRCERRVEAAWRLSQRLPDWRAQRSIAARMIAMRGRCRKGRFVAPAAGVVQSVTRIQALSPRSRAWSNLRPWGIPCGLCFGFRKARMLAAALTEMGHPISADTVDKELVGIGYTRQFNRKTNEGSKNPDRNAQFEYINAKVAEAQRQHQPVISVDTKKKELVGNYKNGGSDYRPKGDPCRVNAHDFEDKKLGKVAPYGVYDVTANTGFVSVGITSDTAEFAMQSIRCWRERMGLMRYPGAQELTVTADCGGSNGARVRLWKRELQNFADETGIAIHVHHYPPGTSKWNKIEHRLFCHITQTWRARPLTSRIAVVESIAATTTKTGLKVESALEP